jgi:hypothetical protein
MKSSGHARVLLSFALLGCVGDPPVSSSSLTDAAVANDAIVDVDEKLRGMPITGDPGCQPVLGTQGTDIFTMIEQWKKFEANAAPCMFPDVGLICMLNSTDALSFATYQTEGPIPIGIRLIYTFDVRTTFKQDEQVSKPISLAQFGWGGVDQVSILLVKPDNVDVPAIVLAKATGNGVSEGIRFDTRRLHRVRVTLTRTEATLSLDESQPVSLDTSTPSASFSFLAQLGPFFPSGSPVGIGVTYRRFLAEVCRN